ncbi:hypothetical protein [Chromobacterium vaccinii]|uniref:hypothetical protein n=1 Tax=Chromobacterium vaccinii TaxID=1108595 RepID=UPI001E31A635|nr:hypothetical protein [Chromobacterium vaccinii]MCD4498966.1 hypothetical protein [Chromobacterium vaccinii]
MSKVSAVSYRLIACSLFSLFLPNAHATVHPGNVAIALGWNTLQLHADQTLAGANPGQYSVKNLFDPSPAKAWVFHAERPHPQSEDIKPVALTLTLAHPSPLFAIALAPGYAKSSSTQFQNASPKLVKISLYRAGEAKPFESRLFKLAYHARQYSAAQLHRELGNTAFVDQTDGLITGKSDNALNTAERLLLINPGAEAVAKVELRVSAIEAGAKYTDTAISKLRLLDRQVHGQSAEYQLAQYVERDLDGQLGRLDGGKLCLAYSAQNPWPMLEHRSCSSPAPRAQIGQADQGLDDIFFTRQDPASDAYQVPFTIALRDAQMRLEDGKRRLRVSAADLRNHEWVLARDSQGALRAWSGMALTQAFLANRIDGMGKAYLQPQDSAYFFFGYARLRLDPAAGGYRPSVYGPAGRQNAAWPPR